MSKKRPSRKPLTETQRIKLIANMGKSLALLKKALDKQDRELDTLDKEIDGLRHWIDHGEDDPPDFGYDKLKPKNPVKPSRARASCQQELA
jgi:hypothetical protein